MQNSKLENHKSIYNVKVNYDKLFRIFYDSNNCSSSEYRDKINILTGHSEFDKKENEWIKNPYVIFVKEISGAYKIVNSEIVKDKKALDILNHDIIDIKADIDYFNNNKIREEQTNEELNKFQKEIYSLADKLEEINCFHEPFFELYIQEFKKNNKRLATTGKNKDTGKVNITSIETNNYWSKPDDEEKHKIYTALNKEKILKYSGEGKPVITMENAILLFKALHDLRLIDESLIYYQPLTKKEYWKPDFIMLEFIRQEKRKDGTCFNNNNIRDNKKNLYTDIDNSLKIEKIKSIIQSALTA